MTNDYDNEIALPKLKYPIHQYKVIRIAQVYPLPSGKTKLVLSRDMRERTCEAFIYDTLTDASRVRFALLRLRRSMRALLSTDED